MRILLVGCVLIAGTAHSQNVGIGTTTPKARLHVADSNVLFTAAGAVSATPGNPPVSGAGRRVMWYADKAAFRSGYTTGNSWDKEKVGNYSFAAGYDAEASGEHSVAMGISNKATGYGSLSMGGNTLAGNDYAFALGTGNTANAYGSTVIGFQSTANGLYSLAAGYNVVAKARGSAVLGSYNDNSDNPDPIDTATTDRIFQVGNGYYNVDNNSTVRKNALTILRNGNTGIGTPAPSPTAVLELAATNKGFLPPRLDNNQRNAIVSPATGLSIYNTSSKAFEVFNGSSWYAAVHYVGENYGGGIVFYTYDNGQHGLIAATSDQDAGSGLPWYCCVISNTPAKANGIGAGLKNTTHLVAIQAMLSGNLTNASTACNQYAPTVNGVMYGDWYLPSMYELNLLYAQKNIVGGFANAAYWSSNEFNDQNSWLQNFGNGQVGTASRSSNQRVRAIRHF